jgi:hypothetical protein
MDEVEGGRPAAWMFVLPICVLLAGVFNAHYFADDAFISLRYAHNLAAGSGLVWNPGGAHVEGFTDPLWVLILSGFAVLNVNLVDTAQVLGVICAATTVILTMVLGRRVFPSVSDWSLVACGILVAGLSPMAIWAAAGLEGPLYALLLVLTVFGIVTVLSGKSNDRTFVGTAVAAGLLALVHAEGVLFVFALIVVVVWATAHSKINYRKSALVIALSVIPVASYEVFRICFFHQLLPNTFYVKASTTTLGSVSRGFIYLGSFVFHRILFVAFLAAIPAARATIKNLAFRVVIILGSLECAFIVYAGGDNLLEYRFIVPLVPFIGLAAIPAFDMMWNHTKNLKVPAHAIIAAVITVVVSATACAFSFHAAVPDLRINTEVMSDRKLIGLYLHRYAPHAFVAVAAAGAIPYYSGERSLDILGLNDSYVAHTASHKDTNVSEQKFNAAYVIREQPDIVVLGQGSLNSDSHAPNRQELEREYSAGDFSYYSVFVRLLQSNKPKYDIVDVQVVPGRWLQALVLKTYTLG